MYAGSYKGVSWGVEEGDGQIIERGGDMEREGAVPVHIPLFYVFCLDILHRAAEA